MYKLNGNNENKELEMGNKSPSMTYHSAHQPQIYKTDEMTKAEMSLITSLLNQG